MLTQKKEKLLIENLLSSGDIFARCVGILKSEYFDQPEYRPIVSFIIDYFSKYNAIPSFDIVNAEFSFDLKGRQITTDEFNYTCDEIEKFCQEQAFIHAISDAVDLIEKGDRQAAHKKVADAMTVSLERDMGIEFYEDPEERLRKMVETEIYHSTGIKGLDDQLAGGLARQTFSLFSANSGVGKSNMLANLGVNYSLAGYNVIYISLELVEKMIDLRLAAIVSYININLWKQKIPEISSKIVTRKNNGAGSYRIKRLKNGATTNDIKAYLKQCELKYKIKPDVIIVDYLDLLHPNGGTKNKGIYEQDKEKSEEFTELLVDYNAIGISASQQNREALRMSSPDQGVIAGGISKVNTVHNYISLIMDDKMLLSGEMLAYFLKTRTSSGRGKATLLSFDPNTLTITDNKNSNSQILTRFTDKRKGDFSKKISAVMEMQSNKIEPILSEKDQLIKSLMSAQTEDIIQDTYQNEELDNDGLLRLMTSFGNTGI